MDRWYVSQACQSAEFAQVLAPIAERPRLYGRGRWRDVRQAPQHVGLPIALDELDGGRGEHRTVPLGDRGTDATPGDPASLAGSRRPHVGTLSACPTSTPSAVGTSRPFGSSTAKPDASSQLRVTSGQKRSALSTATEGQGAVLALPLCLEGLVFSPASGCRSSALPKPLGPGLSASA
jgi:hypothetical protein